MDGKKAIIAIVLLLLVVAVAIIMIAGLGIDVGIGGGYKVTVSGTVHHGALGGDMWFDYRTDVAPDPGIFSISPAWVVNTKCLDVVVEIGYLGQNYKGHHSIGGLNWVLGDSKPFSVELRHVKPGGYGGIISVYEVDKSLFGLGWETSRSIRLQESFIVEVIGE